MKVYSFYFVYRLYWQLWFSSFCKIDVVFVICFEYVKAKICYMIVLVVKGGFWCRNMWHIGC